MERIFNTTVCSLCEDRGEFVGVIGSKSKSVADGCGQHINNFNLLRPWNQFHIYRRNLSSPKSLWTGRRSSFSQSDSPGQCTRGVGPFTDDGGIEDQSDTILNRVSILASTREATQHPEAGGDCLLAQEPQ